MFQLSLVYSTYVYEMEHHVLVGEPLQKRTTVLIADANPK
jgi:hypothetical protein